MKRCWIGMSVFLLSILLLSSASSAGWTISENGKEVALVSKGKMKSTWENGSIIVEGEKNVLHFINDVEKVIASGTAEEFCSAIEKMRDKMMENLPPEHREMVKKMMGSRKPPKVELAKKGAGGKISGFETIRYEVTADGELYEELWLSEDKELLKDFKEIMRIMGKFTQCTAKMGGMGSAISPEATPEYAKVFELGVILKSIGHHEQETEITEMTQRDVKDTEFALPKGYKSVTFEEMWGKSME